MSLRFDTFYTCVLKLRFICISCVRRLAIGLHVHVYLVAQSWFSHKLFTWAILPGIKNNSMLKFPKKFDFFLKNFDRNVT